MSGGYSNPIIGGGGALVYPDIHSPDFSIAGQTGWAIMKNGDAYFYNITAIGTITASTFIGNNFELDDTGFFFYNGTPAAGNPPVLTIVPPGVTADPFGNSVAPVLNIGDQQGAHAGFDDNGNLFFSNSSGTTTIVVFPSLDLIGFYPAGGAAGGLALALAAVAGSDPFANSWGKGLTGSILAFDPVASPNKPEAWHAISPVNAEWVSVGGGVPASYKLAPDGAIEIKGQFEFTSAGTGLSGNNVFSLALPAPYRPLVPQNVWAYIFGGSGSPLVQANHTPLVQVSAGGVLSLLYVTSTATAGDTVFVGFNGRYALTNP
jgi:hypothetical protein